MIEYADISLSISIINWACLVVHFNASGHARNPFPACMSREPGKVFAISSWGKLLGKQNRTPSTWQVFSLVSPHLGPSFSPLCCCWPCSFWSPTFWHSPGCCCCCCSRLLYKLWGVLVSCLLPRLVVLYAWKEHNLIYMFILRELPQFVAFTVVFVLCLSVPHVAATR